MIYQLPGADWAFEQAGLVGQAIRMKRFLSVDWDTVARI